MYKSHGNENGRYLERGVEVAVRSGSYVVLVNELELLCFPSEPGSETPDV